MSDMAKHNMTKISLYLRPPQIQGLVQIASKKHRTNASLIREALDEYLERELQGKRRVRRRRAH
jgi:predicted transcriptional regulator